MINTKPLSKQLSDLNVALGLFRKQIENVVAVNSDKNQIVSQVSSAIREYISMYTGLQMLHSSENTISDMTDQTRQVISSTPFIELRDTLVRMYNRIEVSSIEIPLVNTDQEYGLSIRDGKVLNAQLSISSSKVAVKIVNTNIDYEDSIGAINVYHDSSLGPDGYLNDFRLKGNSGIVVGVPFKVFSFLVPLEYRLPFRLNHTQGSPVEIYIPWSFSLAFHAMQDYKITFGAEIIFKSRTNNSFFSVSKWGNQSFVSDHPTNYLLVEDDVFVDSSYNKTANLANEGYFSTPIPLASDEDSNSVLFSDAALVAVTKASLNKLIKATDELIR